MNTKTTHLQNKDGEIVGIKVETLKETFTVPVLDVRRNREIAELVLKGANIAKGSKYIKPSYSWYGYSYNHSMK